MAFLPSNPRLLLFCSPCLATEAVLLDAASGAPLRTLALPAAAASLAVSPCGELLAFGLADGGVLLSDAQAEASTLLTGHGRGVGALAFDGGGGRLLSAAGEVVWVWHRDALRKE